MVVSAVEGRELDIEPVAESLADLKEVLYDAANVVDDLDYHRLKQGKPAYHLQITSVVSLCCKIQLN